MWKGLREEGSERAVTATTPRRRPARVMRPLCCWPTSQGRRPPQEVARGGEGGWVGGGGRGNDISSAPRLGGAGEGGLEFPAAQLGSEPGGLDLEQLACQCRQCRSYGIVRRLASCWSQPPDRDGGWWAWGVRPHVISVQTPSPSSPSSTMSPSSGGSTSGIASPRAVSWAFNHSVISP